MHYYRAHYITNANFTHYSQGNPSNLPYICILRFHPKMAGICSLATFASGTSPLFLVLLPKSSAVKPIPLRKTTHHFLPMFSKPKKALNKNTKTTRRFQKNVKQKSSNVLLPSILFCSPWPNKTQKSSIKKKKTASIPQQSAMAKVLPPPHTHLITFKPPPLPPILAAATWQFWSKLTLASRELAESPWFMATFWI